MRKSLLMQLHMNGDATWPASKQNEPFLVHLSVSCKPSGAFNLRFYHLQIYVQVSFYLFALLLTYNNSKKGYCLFILYEFAFGYVNLSFKILVE